MTTSRDFTLLSIGSIVSSVKSLLVVFTMFFSGFLYSQDSSREAWVLEESQDGIEVFSKIVSCDTEGSSVPFDYLLFKVVNNSEYQKKVSLKFEIHFDEGCNGCNGNDETSREIDLQPGEILEPSCLNFEDKLSYFILNPNFQDSWHYSHSEVYVQLINN